MDSRGDRDAGGGILPARIDRCLVLAETAPIHRAYRRAEYGADRKDAFTGIGDCLRRLIHRDATKRQTSMDWSALLPSHKPNGGCIFPRKGLRLVRYLSGCTRAVTIRQNPRINRSFEP